MRSTSSLELLNDFAPVQSTRSQSSRTHLFGILVMASRADIKAHPHGVAKLTVRLATVDGYSKIGRACENAAKIGIIILRN